MYELDFFSLGGGSFAIRRVIPSLYAGYPRFREVLLWLATRYSRHCERKQYMAYKKRKPVDIVDKRPEYMVGNEGEIQSKNLAVIQEAIGYTNDQMAEMFGVALSQYERIKSGRNLLTWDKLMILYYNLDVNLNRLVADDLFYDFFRKIEEMDRAEVDFVTMVSDLMIRIERAKNNAVRKEMVEYAYDAFGVMLLKMFDLLPKDK